MSGKLKAMKQPKAILKLHVHLCQQIGRNLRSVIEQPTDRLCKIVSALPDMPRPFLLPNDEELVTLSCRIVSQLFHDLAVDSPDRWSISPVLLSRGITSKKLQVASKQKRQLASVLDEAGKFSNKIISKLFFDQLESDPTYEKETNASNECIRKIIGMQSQINAVLLRADRKFSPSFIEGHEAVELRHFLNVLSFDSSHALELPWIESLFDVTELLHGLSPFFAYAYLSLHIKPVVWSFDDEAIQLLSDAVQEIRSLLNTGMAKRSLESWAAYQTEVERGPVFTKGLASTIDWLRDVREVIVALGFSEVLPYPRGKTLTPTCKVARRQWGPTREESDDNVMRREIAFYGADAISKVRAESPGIGTQRFEAALRRLEQFGEYAGHKRSPRKTTKTNLKATKKTKGARGPKND